MSQETLQSFVGSVDEVEAPTGNGPWKVALGYENGQYHNQKKFIIWATDYETKAPNPNLTVIQAAAANRDEVRVGFTTKQETYNGKTFPRNTIHEVSVVGGASPQAADTGWAAPVQAPPAVPTAGAAPSNIDNVKFVASQMRAAAADLNNMADLLEGK